jgi:oxygen-independent coproporphyrinogen-3 oxidase
VNPFGIYVHWPFCAAKCPYCDFNSHVRADFEEDKYIDALLRELSTVAEWQGEQRPAVETIFFGGGTPSLMKGKSVGRVLDHIAKEWALDPDIEVTLEANPASADAMRFRDYRTAGVDRLSLGLQALNDADLKFLGRLHDSEDAKQAARLALSVFPRVSLDLIYARPKQKVEGWLKELDEALAFGSEHLSLYQLTIEEQTPFALQEKTGALVIPDDDSAVALFEATQERTERAGLPAYEISNHARPGAEARHNLLYWRYGDYAGVGAGAHGRLTFGNKRTATQAEKLPERWRKAVEEQGHGFVEQRDIENDDAAREHLLMNLRLAEGLLLDAYQKRWGVSLSREKIAQLASDGLLELRDGRLIATPQGRLVLNSLIAEIAT